MCISVLTLSITKQCLHLKYNETQTMYWQPKDDAGQLNVSGHLPTGKAYIFKLVHPRLLFQ